MGKVISIKKAEDDEYIMACPHCDSQLMTVVVDSESKPTQIVYVECANCETILVTSDDYEVIE